MEIQEVIIDEHGYIYIMIIIYIYINMYYVQSLCTVYIPNIMYAVILYSYASFDVIM